MSVSSFYEMNRDEFFFQEWDDLKAEVDAFATAEGRRPRVMVAKLGQDGHDRGAKVVATALADLGFDIDIGPLFQTPEEAARQAIENDCHAIGYPTWPPATRPWFPPSCSAQDQGAEDIIVFVGGVIPAQDYDFLYQAGAAGIFGRGPRSRPAQASAGRNQGHAPARVKPSPLSARRLIWPRASRRHPSSSTCLQPTDHDRAEIRIHRSVNRSGSATEKAPRPPACH